MSRHGWMGLLLLAAAGLVLAACTTAAVETPHAQASPTGIQSASSLPTLSPNPSATFLPSQTLEPIPLPSGTPALPQEAPTVSPAGPFPTFTPENTLEPTPTATPIVPSTGGDINRPAFDVFVESVKNGNPNQIVGVYVENVLALRVVQQPSNNPAFVSVRNGEATQFALALSVAGNIGLLAHNYLSGELFFQLRQGDIAQLIYGDGSVLEYEVSEVLQFQALNPRSPTSDFVDLQTGETLSATNLFYRVYGGDHHLTFQTCINQDNDSEWGRLFVIAQPLP